MKRNIRSGLAGVTMFFACVPASRAELVPLEAKRALVEATSNARQIGLMLFEFETDYGWFPNDKTRVDVEESTGVKLPAGDKSSNAMFRQLHAAGITGAEAPFFARIPGVKKGDNEIEGGKFLARGENGFAYIAGMSTAGDPSRPLVICPLIPGTTKFDPKPFDGKAVILRVDNSVQALPITEDGKVLEDGVDILSKDHPRWKGKAPDIRHPEPFAAG